MRSPTLERTTTAADRHVFDRDDILSTLDVTPLKREDFIVIGGANLVLREIRERTGDIDLLVTNEGFMKLVHTLGSQLKDPPQSAIENGAWMRAVVLERPGQVPVSGTEEMGDLFTMTHASASENAIKIGGVLCQSIDQIIQSKTAIGRPVDIADLELLSTHMKVELHIPAAPLRLPSDS